LYAFGLNDILSQRSKQPEIAMPQTLYKISEARKHFAEVLDRANHGEEIIIMRGNEVYARIGPADGGKRPFGLLRQRGLPDDLFDDVDAEQTAIDAGDWNDDVGVWQGKSSNRDTSK
jgi:prevent-host-death family protein